LKSRRHVTRQIARQRPLLSRSVVVTFFADRRRLPIYSMLLVRLQRTLSRVTFSQAWDRMAVLMASKALRLVQVPILGVVSSRVRPRSERMRLTTYTSPSFTQNQQLQHTQQRIIHQERLRMQHLPFLRLADLHLHRLRVLFPPIVLLAQRQALVLVCGQRARERKERRRKIVHMQISSSSLVKAGRHISPVSMSFRLKRLAVVVAAVVVAEVMAGAVAVVGGKRFNPLLLRPPRASVFGHA
jgi:hypothetical protein